jgi:hypothetical protein
MTTITKNSLECNIKPKPFVIKNHYRYEFRDWIQEQFPQLSSHANMQRAYPRLAERLNEVHSSAMKVLDMVDKYSCEELKEYYRPDRILLEKAYKERNLIDYTRSLDSFAFAITWE